MPKSTVPQPVQITAARFYGYPPAQIAEWCGISYQQACRLKRGESKPTKGTLKLFELHRSGQVLSPAFAGFRISGDKIADPEGNLTTAAQLRMYGMMLQFMAEITRSDDSLRTRYRELLEANYG